MQFRSSGTHLALPNRSRAEIIKHCLSAYPKEACGILAGNTITSTEKPPREALYVYPMRNVEESPVGYSMDPKEQLLVEKKMRERGQRMLGIYHSHTATEAIPSPVDVSLAISPDISYLLVSLKDRSRPDIKTYRIVDGEILRENLLREEGKV
ncbi:MAG: M67 family metallopeptidase [Candidatus Omnitrophica bacterium]|nr:M67 family metallopeptidase [Candidatus Omnitrophota bacterium]